MAEIFAVWRRFYVEAVNVVNFFKKAMKPIFVWLIAAVLALACSASAQNNEPKLGDSPPRIRLQKLLQAPEGAKADWAALEGKVVVLEFWATWCGPCVAAIPHLNELADRFKGQPVQFIAITDESPETIEPFLKRKPIHAWVGLNTDKAMFKAYGITGIPHTVIVSKTGKIAGVTHPVNLTESVLEDALAGKKLALGEPTGNRRGGIRAGEVPYDEAQGQPSLLQVVIRPSAADEGSGSGMASGSGGITITRCSVFSVLSHCYDISPVRIVTNCALPEGKFDFVVKTPSKSGDVARAWLRQAVESAFGLSAKREARDRDVFVLSAPNSEEVHLAPTVSTGGSSSSSGPGRMQGVNLGISSLAGFLEGYLGKPVLDNTGLTNRYDFELKWNEGTERPTPDVLRRAVREQLGLELAAATRPVEILVVEKAEKQAK